MKSYSFNSEISGTTFDRKITLSKNFNAIFCERKNLQRFQTPILTLILVSFAYRYMILDTPLSV